MTKSNSSAMVRERISPVNGRSRWVNPITIAITISQSILAERAQRCGEEAARRFRLDRGRCPKIRPSIIATMMAPFTIAGLLASSP